MFTSPISSGGLHRVRTGIVPSPTPPIRQLNEYHRLYRDPIHFALCVLTLIGVNASDAILGPMTGHQIYYLLTKGVRLFYIALRRKLRFDRDNEGRVLSNHEMLMEFPLPVYAEWNKRFAEYTLSPSYNDRSSRGYVYRSIVVKEPLVYFLHSEKARAHFTDFDQFFELVDGIQTVQDSTNSVMYFGESAKELITEQMGMIRESDSIRPTLDEDMLNRMMIYWAFS